MPPIPSFLPEFPEHPGDIFDVVLVTRDA